MDETMLGLAIFAGTIFVLVSGIPVGFALTAVAFGCLMLFGDGGGLGGIARTFLDEIWSFALLTVPMFLLMGNAVSESPAGKDIYESMHRWIARLPGGLVVANIMSCGLFAGLTGASPATVAAIGKAGIPEMMARGYPARLAAGAIGAGGTLGILIPPSVTLIIYGIATETSIGRLFLAGVLPGVLLIALFSAYAWLTSRRAHAAAVQDPSIKTTYSFTEKMEGIWRVLPFLLVIVGIIFAMYGGVASPSEVAGIAALLVVVMVLFIYRVFGSGTWKRVFFDTLSQSAMLFIILAAAGLYSFMMSYLYLAQSMASALIALDLNIWGLLAVVNVLLLLLGCFLPPVAIIVMTMPILQPILEANNIDLVWWGIIMTINMEIGLITPPLGLNLFVIKSVAPSIEFRDIILGILPFIALMLAAIVMIVVFPGIALWLPNLMMDN